MSEEDGTADCSNMILTSVGLQSFLFLRRKSRELRAGATSVSDTFRAQRRHSTTQPHLTTSRQSFSTLRRSYPCLGHISWPETALSNAPMSDNVSTDNLNAAAETGLILRWTKIDSPLTIYVRPEGTYNLLSRSSVALRFPVTREKCVAPPRLRECKEYPSSPRLKKESRS